MPRLTEGAKWRRTHLAYFANPDAAADVIGQFDGHDPEDMELCSRARAGEGQRAAVALALSDCTLSRMASGLFEELVSIRDKKDTVCTSPVVPDHGSFPVTWMAVAELLAAGLIEVQIHLRFDAGGRQTSDALKDQMWPPLDKRSQQLRDNGGKHTNAEWRRLVASFDYRCVACLRQEPNVVLTKDHVIPVSKGGRDDIANIAPLCKSCNSRKKTTSTDYRVDFAERLQALRSEG